MFKIRRAGLLLAALAIVALLVAACQPETVEVPVEVEVTRVISETITEEGEEVEVTRVITEQVVVTATPEPAEEVSLTAPDPTTYTHLTFGDVNTMDP
ncbi:MAG TPA: hypothetical protein VF177_21875, partial [Anaerolineae bacterium]